jgi:hypothetical protein
MKNYQPKPVLVNGESFQTIKEARDFMNAHLPADTQIPEWKIYYALRSGKTALEGFTLTYAEREGKASAPRQENRRRPGRDALMPELCTSGIEGYTR